MNSNFNKLYIDGLWTQWAFHRVQEHLKRSFLLSYILLFIFLPFMFSLFIYIFTIHYYVFTIHYYVFTIQYSLLCIHYYVFTINFTMHYILCTMHYALCTMHYALFICIHTYSLFHMTKSRDFGTYA